MAWASELPQELLCRPLGLVALTGLDTTYNAVHKAIWDSFCNNRRPDRLPLNFKVFTTDHEYPKCKGKRSSYEPYIPKGILKSAWMQKQLNAVPAVVVIFFDLDWDDMIWKEKQMECSTKVEIVRNGLLNRGTRVCVVLIQKNAPLPPGEDVQASERAASLCTACELSAKSLFVLPLTDHLLGYTIRLENAFYEMVQSYYHTEARKVKAHKDFLNKTTHQLLYVRHQFKIAFYSELKQDTHTALKHYKQAYGHVLEIVMHDTNLLEVKSIAGFINYKVCRLSFQHNTPLDSIAQFRKHIDFFKSKTGPAELAFEHSAWMSRQFQIFGDLFDEAIKLGLTAIQTQHPGFYFQQAANHAIARKKFAAQLCQGAAERDTSSEVLAGLDNLDFFGQRPWRQGHQSIEPPDAGKEKEGVEALQALESKQDHSSLIIPLLSNAVQQFKKYKSPRMKRNLMVQMGEEYFDAQDYNKSLTLLSRVTWEYRQERWWLLLTSILQTALRCSYLVGNVQEYVTVALELIAKHTLNSLEDKSRIQQNLLSLLKGEVPGAEPECKAECVEKAETMWTAPPTPPALYTIEMNNICAFVECKACFTKESFTADSPVVIKVFIRTSCPLAVEFSKLAVLLNNVVYKDQCIITAENDQDRKMLHVQPGQINAHTFSFLPHRDDVMKTLEISSVVLELGTAGQRCAILHWTGGGGDMLMTPVNQGAHYKSKKRFVPTDMTPWEQIEIHAQTRIRPRESELGITIEHAAPCLVNEFYKMQVTVNNSEEHTVHNVRFDVGLLEAQGIELANSTRLSVAEPACEGAVTPYVKDLLLEDLKPGQQTSKIVYLKAVQPGDRKISVKVSYDIEVNCDAQQLKCACVKEDHVTLNVVHPFTTHFSIASLQFNTVDSVHVDEPFLVLSDLQCTSPWKLDIRASSYTLATGVTFVDEKFESHLEGICLKKTDCASECQCVVVKNNVSQLQLGQYHVHWRRKSEAEEDSLPFVQTTNQLPAIAVEHLPLLVDLDLPAYGNVRQGMPVAYNIYNKTPYAQEIEISMESSESFMFCGQKQFHFRILPNSKYQLKYIYVPLLPGNSPLPKIRFNMLRFPGTMDSVLQKMLPSHVFIMPSGKQPTCENEHPLTA